MSSFTYTCRLFAYCTCMSVSLNYFWNVKNDWGIINYDKLFQNLRQKSFEKHEYFDKSLILFVFKFLTVHSYQCKSEHCHVVNFEFTGVQNLQCCKSCI